LTGRIDLRSPHLELAAASPGPLCLSESLPCPAPHANANALDVRAGDCFALIGRAAQKSATSNSHNAIASLSQCLMPLQCPARDAARYTPARNVMQEQPVIRIHLTRCQQGVRCSNMVHYRNIVAPLQCFIGGSWLHNHKSNCRLAAVESFNLRLMCFRPDLWVSQKASTLRPTRALHIDGKGCILGVPSCDCLTLGRRISIQNPTR
jgi:hypothetical protein